MDKNKIVVITGTSSGFGNLMVKTLAAAGHTVVATMREATGKNRASASLLEQHENVEVVSMDVTDQDSIRLAVASVLERHQQIDVLINNAGVQGNGLMEAYSLDQFHRMMDTNVYGVLRMYQQVLPGMRGLQNGLIISISGNVGRFSPPFQVPYNTTKFALEGITEGLYDELIGQGIETILVEPGLFMTGLYSKPGIHADREDVQKAYGEDTVMMMAGFGEKLGMAMQSYQPDPQVIADTVLKLINMEKGTRPLRTPVDLIADGIDKEFNEVTKALKAKWMRRYLF